MPGPYISTHHPHVKSPAERFWTKVEFTDTCWLWRGNSNWGGYGSFWHSEKRPQVRAHRWAYEFCIAPIPDGLQIDHLCRVRLCVHPFHLEAVTHRENTLRGEGVAAIQYRKTHCKYGHEFNDANTIYRKNGKHVTRMCRACIVRNRSMEMVNNPAMGGDYLPA